MDDWKRYLLVTENDNDAARLSTALEADEQGVEIVRTTAVGVPHLVKVSYFPNWKAKGADGPFRAAPALMVVVPTEEQVSLEFRSTWAEYLGMALSLAGLLFVVAAAIVNRRRVRV